MQGRFKASIGRQWRMTRAWRRRRTQTWTRGEEELLEAGSGKLEEEELLVAEEEFEPLGGKAFLFKKI